MRCANLLYARFALLRAGLRQRGIIPCQLYPALTPSARKRASGPCWAILSSRLSALLLRSYGLIATFNGLRIVAAALGVVLNKSQIEAVLRHFQKVNTSTD
jgi:hypothetical protein